MENWINTHITLPAHPQTLTEEKENSLSHLIGLVFYFFTFFHIITRPEIAGHPGSKYGMIIFSLSNIALFSCSALYHGLTDPMLKKVFRIFDHSTIYILIAGSYTPILMFAGTPLADAYVIGIWSAAFIGIFLTIKFWGKLYVLHVFLYAAMGWSIVSIWSHIVPRLPEGLMPFVLAGGITYTIGLLFYSIRKIPHNHFIWHIFVLAGSLIYYYSYTAFLLA